VGGLTSPKTYAALAAFQAVDAVACAIPVPPVAKSMDTLGVPENIRWLLPASKAASVIGLLSASRIPSLARLTTAMLTVYFVLAVGARPRPIRERDPGGVVFGHLRRADAERTGPGLAEPPARWLTSSTSGVDHCAVEAGR
jgi:hypothetical protein